MALRTRSSGKTDIGKVRKGNEDFLHLDPVNHVYAVCDGMGGHQAGEVASRAAAGVLGAAYKTLQADLLADDRLVPLENLPARGDLLIRAIRLANRQVCSRAAADPSLSGMGTTIVAVVFEEDLMSVAHVGDSRAYRLAPDHLEPLTSDHSWSMEIQNAQKLTEEEANKLVGKNVITRALGVRETVEVDYRQLKVSKGDVFILCSDGLCGFAGDDEIFQAAGPHRGNLDDITEALVALALEKGGADNVTIVAVEVVDVGRSDTGEMEAVTVGEESDDELQVESEWLEKIDEAMAVSDALTDPVVPETGKLETVAPQSGKSGLVETSSGEAEAGHSKLWTVVIFFLFIIVAAAIIYYSTVK